MDKLTFQNSGFRNPPTITVRLGERIIGLMQHRPIPGTMFLELVFTPEDSSVKIEHSRDLDILKQRIEDYYTKAQAPYDLNNPPEYVYCVKLETHESTQYWCGKPIENPKHFMFLDIDHAAINGRNQGRLIACFNCKEAIIRALNNGYES